MFADSSPKRSDLGVTWAMQGTNSEHHLGFCNKATIADKENKRIQSVISAAYQALRTTTEQHRHVLSISPARSITTVLPAHQAIAHGVGIQKCQSTHLAQTSLIYINGRGQIK